MNATEKLNVEEILCVNGEFYIFLTQANRQIDIHIESEGKFQTWKGTKDDLRKAAIAKESNGEFGLDMLSRNDGEEIFIKENGEIKYTLTFETKGSQVRLGINAPKNLGILRDNALVTK